MMPDISAINASCLSRRPRVSNDTLKRISSSRKCCRTTMRRRSDQKPARYAAIFVAKASPRHSIFWRTPRYTRASSHSSASCAVTLSSRRTKSDGFFMSIGEQCRDQRSLIKHSWEHSREKNHSCSKCGKTFHNKARLKRHISLHRNKSVMCEVCHEKFPDSRQLMNHRHLHTKANQFPCHECGKTFGSRSSQQIHIRIHTGERPYGYRFCWKAFADRWNVA